MNIAELIQKNFKKGDILYSPLFGDVELLSVDLSDRVTPISVAVTKDTGAVQSDTFNPEGQYLHRYSNAECMIFPNRNKTWKGYY